MVNTKLFVPFFLVAVVSASLPATQETAEAVVPAAIERSYAAGGSPQQQHTMSYSGDLVGSPYRELHYFYFYVKYVGSTSCASASRMAYYTMYSASVCHKTSSTTSEQHSGSYFYRYSSSTECSGTFTTHAKTSLTCSADGTDSYYPYGTVSLTADEYHSSTISYSYSTFSSLWLYPSSTTCSQSQNPILHYMATNTCYRQGTSTYWSVSYINSQSYYLKIYSDSACSSLVSTKTVTEDTCYTTGNDSFYGYFKSYDTLSGWAVLAIFAFFMILCCCWLTLIPCMCFLTIPCILFWGIWLLIAIAALQSEEN